MVAQHKHPSSSERRVGISGTEPIAGHTMVLDFFQGWAPTLLVNAISSFSFLTHFNAIMNGVIDLRDLVFFGSLIALSLFINAVVIDLRRAD